MTARPVPTFEFVEAEVRKKTFGVLTTVDRKGRPHSTGILYGVAPPTSPFALYFLTLEEYVKVRNVKLNSSASYPLRVRPFAARLRWFPSATPMPAGDLRNEESFATTSLG